MDAITVLTEEGAKEPNNVKFLYFRLHRFQDRVGKGPKKRKKGNVYLELDAIKKNKTTC